MSQGVEQIQHLGTQSAFPRENALFFLCFCDILYNVLLYPLKN